MNSIVGHGKVIPYPGDEMPNTAFTDTSLIERITRLRETRPDGESPFTNELASGRDWDQWGDWNEFANFTDWLK